MRTIPVVRRGDRYVIGMSLDAVDEFVGIARTTDLDEPEPGELIDRIGRVTAIAIRAGHQLPPSAYQTQIEGRDRTYLDLVGHIVGHVGRFVKIIEDPTGDYSDVEVLGPLGQPPDGASVAELDVLAVEQQEALVRWWRAYPDLEQQLQTYFGEQTTGWLLASTAYSVVQHTRQLLAVLDLLNIEPAVRLSEADLLGLRLPRGIWDEADQTPVAQVADNS